MFILLEQRHKNQPRTLFTSGGRPLKDTFSLCKSKGSGQLSGISYWALRLTFVKEERQCSQGCRFDTHIRGKPFSGYRPHLDQLPCKCMPLTSKELKNNWEAVNTTQDAKAPFKLVYAAGASSLLYLLLNWILKHLLP